MKASTIRVVGLRVVAGLSIVLLAYNLLLAKEFSVVQALGGGLQPSPPAVLIPSRPRCVNVACLRS